MRNQRTKPNEWRNRFLWNAFGIPTTFDRVLIDVNGEYLTPKNIKYVDKVGEPKKFIPNDYTFTSIYSYLSKIKYNETFDGHEKVDSYYVLEILEDPKSPKNPDSPRSYKLQGLARIPNEDSELEKTLESNEKVILEKVSAQS
jgi:hypothetical protein